MEGCQVDRSISFTILFPECCRILDEVLRPVSVLALTRLAITRLGYTGQCDAAKVYADIREKLLLASARGCCFIGKPFYYGAKLCWFNHNQAELIPCEEIIPCNLHACLTGGAEAHCRIEAGMINTQNEVDPFKRAMKAVKGFVLESHVRDYFKRRWPTIVSDPPNNGKWHMACDHDFSITTSLSRVVKIDVAGPDANGRFGLRGYKKATDLHVLAETDVDRNAIVIKGYYRGCEFTHDPKSANLRSVTEMIVKLNCVAHRLPYSEMESAIRIKKQHK